MRFISRYGRFGIQIRPMIQEAYATGMAKVVQEPVYAMFETGKLFPHERELAIATWVFNGFYQLEDEVTIMPPDYRIGVFDSDEAQIANGWSDELREEVERILILNGQHTFNIIPVPRTMIPAPWPRYDEFKGSVERLIERLIEDGHNLDATLTYERAMQNRPEVVAALEALIADPDALLELQPAEEITG